MKRKFFSALLTNFLLSFTFAHAAALDCPDCDVTEAREAQYNRLLNLTPAQQKTALSRHLVYGLPAPAVNATGPRKK